MQFDHDTLPAGALRARRGGGGAGRRGGRARRRAADGDRLAVVAGARPRSIRPASPSRTGTTRSSSTCRSRSPSGPGRPPPPHDVDALVSIGGGSATGLAKAVALTTGLPIVAVPTTYAGSEVTDVWGLTEDGRKTTGSDPGCCRARSSTTPSSRSSLPVRPERGVRAQRPRPRRRRAVGAPGRPDHAALAGRASGPWASDSRGRRRPAGLAGRSTCSTAPTCRAVAFAPAGSGLHHKICHVLGGRYDLPHAQTHAVVLPHVARPQRAGRARGRAADRRRLGRRHRSRGLAATPHRLDAPRSLRDLGFEKEAIPGAVEAILPLVPASNPATVTAGSSTTCCAPPGQGTDPR